MTADAIHCGEHGTAYEAYVCEHLVGACGLSWHSHVPDSERPWPDAWCGSCHKVFEAEGEWNEVSEASVKIKIVCHNCYEATKARCVVTYL